MHKKILNLSRALNPKKGRHKARVFESTLGITLNNQEVLGDMKVDLAIAQIDALEFFAKVMKPQGIDVFRTIRVILNLYLRRSTF